LETRFRVQNYADDSSFEGVGLVPVLDVSCCSSFFPMRPWITNDFPGYAWCIWTFAVWSAFVQQIDAGAQHYLI